MDALLKHIQQRLITRKFCIIFQDEIQRVWPSQTHENEKQIQAIHAFAKANGLFAVIHDPGIRVTFRKLAPP